MKTFEQWWISLGIGRPEDTEVYDSEYDGYFRAEQAWSALDAEWKQKYNHDMRNKDAAYQLKSEAFDLLKKKNEELETRLEQIKKDFELTTRPAGTVSLDDLEDWFKEIRQRHGLDGVKS